MFFLKTQRFLGFFNPPPIIICPPHAPPPPQKKKKKKKKIVIARKKGGFCCTEWSKLITFEDFNCPRKCLHPFCPHLYKFKMLVLAPTLSFYLNFYCPSIKVLITKSKHGHSNKYKRRMMRRNY